ncbi:MAG TPA: hypothetical protein VLM42_13025 [Bryobacteraceae bacterium]|nr:hypothetical protein [Bryobacteraceae bacterium]
METKAVRRTMLCSEIINLHLQVRAGRSRELKANLEEIWPAGAILWTDVRIRQYTSLWFHGGGFEFRGQVMAHTVLRGLGYLIEMRFDPGCRWSEQKYRPKHLFNPLVLLANRVFETTLCATRSPFDHPRQAAFARTAAAAPLKAAYGS